MSVVPINPALIPQYQVAPGTGTGTTQNPLPAGQSGNKVVVDPKNTMNPTLYQAPPDASSSTPPQGGSSTGTGSAPPAPMGPVITFLSVVQGQPGDPVMITGSNFGPGLGEIHFVIANGKDVKAPAGAIWSDGQIFTSVPDATGLLAFNGQVYIKRTTDQKLSNLVAFRFEPARELRSLGCSRGWSDHRIQDDQAQRYPAGCVEHDGAADLIGKKNNDEFFLSKTVKNGWTVDSTDVRPTYIYGTSGAYNWGDRVGTNSPYINIRWWHNPFSVIGYTFTIRIVGPKGVPDGLVVP